jgi:hypothetical protein
MFPQARCRAGIEGGFVSEVVQSQVAASSALDHWIWAKLENWEVPASLRNRMAGAAFLIAFHHHQAILRLVNVGSMPSASALVRPIFEAGITGMWIANCATDRELDQFAANNRRPKTETMVKLLEASDFLEKKPLSTIKAANWAALSDYTHCGSRALQRMIGMTLLARLSVPKKLLK